MGEPKMTRFEVPRLTALEFKKLFKGKTLYIVLAVMALFAVISTIGQANNYSTEKIRLNNQMSSTLNSLEHGMLNTAYLPPGFNTRERPLHENFVIIPENLKFYQELFTDYFQSEIDSLTAEGGRYSLGGIMGHGASQAGMILPLLGMVLAVGMFAGEHRGGYRIMIGRGVRRSQLMTAKLVTTLGTAVGLAGVFTFALLLSGLAADGGIGGPGLSGLSSTSFYGIFGVALLMLAAYMLVGGVVGVVAGSAFSAMAVGMVLAFISVAFFFASTPEDDFFLAAFTPVSLGYNFNSLMYYVWRGGEEISRYREVVPSLAFVTTYAIVYIGFIYGVFVNKELKG